MVMLSQQQIDKLTLRSRKGPDISVGPDGFEGFQIDILQRWQREFQGEFCKHCHHFDPITGDFKEKGPPANKPDDCSHHLTDIVGVCWSFKERDTGRSISEIVWDSVDAIAAKSDPPDSHSNPQ